MRDAAAGRSAGFASVGAAALAAVALGSCNAHEDAAPGAALAALVGAAPAVAAVRAITVEDLVGVRDIDAVVLSPQGDRVAYLLRRADPEADAYVTGWFVANLDGGEPAVYLGDGGEPQLAARADGHEVGEVASPRASWSPDGRWFAYAVQADGQTQLWRSDAVGLQRAQLTALPADVVDFAWEPDGRSLVVWTRPISRAEAATRRADEARRGFLLDDRFNPGHAATPLYRAADEQGLGAAWSIDVETGRAAPISRAAPSTSARDVGASADGRSRAELIEEPGARQPESRRLAAAMEGALGAACDDVRCSGALEIVGWTADGGEIAFLRRFGVARRLTSLNAWSPDDGRVREVVSGEAVLDTCWIAAHEQALCVSEAATEPRRLVVIDLEDGAIRTLVDPNPELGAVRFGGVETIDLTNPLGHESFAQILTPPDVVEGRRYPVVVVTYRSRGFLRGGVGDEYPPHLFAAAGFVVLSFDMPDADLYPTSATDAFPGCPACAAGELRHASAAASLELGLKALEDRGLMDRDRVAVTGLSSGASIVFDALTRSDRPFAAAIASYAAGDPISGYVGHGSWRESWFDSIGGLPEAGGAAYLAHVSPALNAARIETPLLLNLADRELIMSLQTIATLEHLGKPVEAYVYEGERHVKRSPAHRDAIYRRNLQWLRFWLQDIEPDDPLDPEQTARWRRLRVQALAVRAASG